MSLTRLVILFADPERQPEVLETEGGEVARYDVLREGEAAGWAEGRTILVVPGAEAAARWLDLPAASDAQARSAAGFMLEETLAAASEAQHIAVGEREPAGRLTVVVDAGRLRGWLDRAAFLGVRPDLVSPDHLILPPPEDDSLVGVRFGPLLAVRGQGYALSGEADLLEAVLGERLPRATGPLDSAALLARGALAPPVNLLQGAFAPGAARQADGGWRRALVLAGLVLVSPLVLLLADAARQQGRAWSLEDQAAARAVAMAPAARGEADPAAFVLRQIDTRRSADSFLTTAAALFRTLETAGGIRLDTLVHGRDGALRATIAYANYSDMEVLKAAAAEAGLALTEDSTVTDNGAITSDLIIRSAAR